MCETCLRLRKRAIDRFNGSNKLPFHAYLYVMPAIHPDNKYIEALLHHDPALLDELYSRYSGKITHMVLQNNGSEADAADIFQNVCVILLEHLHELKDETRITPWLQTTTMRLCMAAAGEKQREVATPDEEFEDQLDPSLTLEEIRLLTEAQQDLRDRVRALPAKCRDLIEMLYFDQRYPSYQEISNKLGIPVGAISPTRNRCLEKLKRILEQHGPK